MVCSFYRISMENVVDSGSEAIGAYWGIGPKTTKADFARASLEGISYSLLQITNMLVQKEKEVHISDWRRSEKCMGSVVRRYHEQRSKGTTKK